MIRSTKVSLKFANPGKKDQLREFVKEYSRLVSWFMGELWDMEKVTRLLPKEMTSRPESWLQTSKYSMLE